MCVFPFVRVRVRVCVFACMRKATYTLPIWYIDMCTTFGSCVPELFSCVPAYLLPSVPETGHNCSDMSGCCAIIAKIKS